MMDTSAEMLRVLIADRHELFRRGVSSVLLDGYPHWLSAQATSAEELHDLLAEQPADLVLLELGLPGLDGVAGIGQLRTMYPNCVLMVLGQREDRPAILECLDAGAQGYVSKAASPIQLLRAVETVLSGAVVAPASLAGGSVLLRVEAVQGKPCLMNFTGRQSDVFRLLAEGCATKTIARRLGLAVGTVKVHLGAIYRQLGVNGRLEALAKAHEVRLDELAFGEAQS